MPRIIASVASVGWLFALAFACGTGSERDAFDPDSQRDGGGRDSGRGDANSDDTDADAAAPATRPFDWVGVIGTGQSLSVGIEGSVVISTQPFKNQKLVDSGPDPKYAVDGRTTLALAPLVEPFRGRVAGYVDDQYPNNVYGETPNTGMANELSALWKTRTGVDDYVSVHSVVGWSGHPLADIDKRGATRGRAYPGSLAEARAFARLAKAQGKTYGVGAIVLTHGENDASNAAYGQGLVTLINDYNADLKAITGQSRDVVLLASQQSTFNSGPSGSAVQVWRAGVDYPGKIVCTGPKYQFGYSGDNLHLPAAGYRALGEKYAEVFDEVVNKGRAWKPLQPNGAKRTGATITVTFDVPVPPLAWSQTLSPPHQLSHGAWKNGRGFEVSRSGLELAIANVTLSGPSTVTIALAGDPGGPVTLGYALTQDGDGFQGGQPAGLRGQLRDSDELVGYDEEAIPVNVTTGSTTLNARSPGGFARRAVRDIVTGTGVAVGTTIAGKASNDVVVLSAPYTGASGVASVKVHHDLHNYAVHFVMTVP